jgi:hypothetical protein
MGGWTVSVHVGPQFLIFFAMTFLYNSSSVKKLFIFRRLFYLEKIVMHTLRKYLLFWEHILLLFFCISLRKWVVEYSPFRLPREDINLFIYGTTTYLLRHLSSIIHGKILLPSYTVSSEKKYTYFIFDRIYHKEKILLSSFVTSQETIISHHLSPLSVVENTTNFSLCYIETNLLSHPSPFSTAAYYPCFGHYNYNVVLLV